MVSKVHLIWAIFTIYLKLGWSLPPFMDVGDGSCSNLQLRPVDVNPDFANNLQYFGAGNKIVMYLFASVLPNYNQISESQFPFEACYKRTVTSNLLDIFGFGQHLSTWQVSQDGPFIGFVQINPKNDQFVAKCAVTLTDGHSFIVVTCCKTLLDEKEWVLFTKTTHVDARTKSLVQSHVISMGFDWNKAIFLNYEGCHMGLEHVHNSYNSYNSQY